LNEKLAQIPLIFTQQENAEAFGAWSITIASAAVTGRDPTPKKSEIVRSCIRSGAWRWARPILSSNWGAVAGRIWTTSASGASASFRDQDQPFGHWTDEPGVSDA